VDVIVDYYLMWEFATVIVGISFFVGGFAWPGITGGSQGRLSIATQKISFFTLVREL